MTDEKKASHLQKPSRRFVENVAGLRVALDDSMSSIARGLRHEDEHFREFANKYGEPIESESEKDGKETRWKFPARFAPTAVRLMRHANRLAMGAKLVPKSFVVALVSQFDVLVSGLLRGLDASRPELLTHEDKSVTLADLEMLGSVEAVREHLLEKEVESLLRKSHAEQFEWLENRFKVKLREFASWPNFVEICQRRNLLVHADGRVSQQYLQVCRKHGASVDADVKEGDLLQVDPSYWKSSSGIVYEVGVKLAQVLWRKVLPEELEEADDELNRIIYDLLLHRRFALAERLSKFACTELPRHSSNEARLVMLVNHAISVEWQDRSDECCSILDAEDWSACAPKFLLAVAVLRGEFDRAVEIMHDIGVSSGLEEAYHEWPLFRRFRKDARFLSAYQEIFERPFENIMQDVRDMERRLLRQKLDAVIKSIPGSAEHPNVCNADIPAEAESETESDGDTDQVSPAADGATRRS